MCKCRRDPDRCCPGAISARARLAFLEGRSSRFDIDGFPFESSIDFDFDDMIFSRHFDFDFDDFRRSRRFRRFR